MVEEEVVKRERRDAGKSRKVKMSISRVVDVREREGGRREAR
jgi:hypothetical protein